MKRVAGFLILQSMWAVTIAAAQTGHQPHVAGALVNGVEENLPTDPVSVAPDLLQRAVAREATRLSYLIAPSRVVAVQERDAQPRERKLWRTVGAIAGGVGAFMIYGPIAFSDSRINVSDSQRTVELSAVTAAGAIAGYFVGRGLDRK
jgi:hypothetical protein